MLSLAAGGPGSPAASFWSGPKRPLGQKMPMDGETISESWSLIEQGTGERKEDPMSAILDTAHEQALATSPDTFEDRPTLTFFDLIAAVAEVADNDAESIAIVRDLIRSGRVRVADLPLLVLPEPSQVD